MSFSYLCVISIDCYSNVVSNTYYKRIVIKRLQPVSIDFVIVTSFILTTFEAVFLAGVDRRELGKGYIALATCCEALMVINITINVALLTKTIAIVVSTFVTAYLPTLVNQHKIPLKYGLYWTMIPTQLNAFLNSVICLATISDIKKYCCNLFNCGKADKKLRITASPVPDVRENLQKHKNVYSLE